MKWGATSIRQSYMDLAATEEGNRNDLIAAAAFGATIHHPPTDFEALRQYDVVFCTMWKVATPTVEGRWMEILHRLKDETNTKVVLFQEAELEWPLSRPWEEQRSFYELLGKVDLLLTHNRRELKLWEPFRKGKPSVRWRTCLWLDNRIEMRIPVEQKAPRAIVFGSSFDNRANGLIGFVACSGIPDVPLWHQERSPGYEERNADLYRIIGRTPQRDIPHSTLNDWMRQIAPAYLIVHPMAAAAAGRDQITYACLGIPCIGNKDCDVQQELFPTLAVDRYDVAGIRLLATRALHDREFYMGARKVAMDRVHNFGAQAAAEQADQIRGMLG